MLENLMDANEIICVSVKLQEIADSLSAQGIRAKDAMHLSAASAARVEVFLTTDDILIRRAKKLDPPLGFTVINPLDWVKRGMTK